MSPPLIGGGYLTSHKAGSQVKAPKILLSTANLAILDSTSVFYLLYNIVPIYKKELVF